VVWPRWLDRLRRLVAAAQRTEPVRFFQRYADDNLPDWAAAVAFHAFFSLFPIVLTLWTLVGVVLRDDARLLLLTSALQQAMPPEGAQQVIDVLRSTRANPGLLGLLSTVGLVYSGAALFGSLEMAFNKLYGAANRGFVQQKLMATGLLLLFAALLLLSLAAASVAEAVHALTQQVATVWLGDLPGRDQLVTLGERISTLGWILPGGWAFLFFLMIYAVVPHLRLMLRQVWPGAATAALLFVAISQIFPLYLRYLGHFDRYGAAFALTLLLLTWFFFLAHSILIGAAINAYYFGPTPRGPNGTRHTWCESAAHTRYG
jgi:membrane protein